MKNIIYIHSHDTGRYIEPYGRPVKTPNLMEFAQNATVFRQAYCAAPNCSPSRAAMLTGMMPHVNGMVGLAHHGTKIKDYSWHLSNYLRSSSYETVCCGIQHEASEEKASEWLGYEKYFAQNRDSDRSPEKWDIDTAQAAVEYLRGSDKKQPFFMNVGFFYPHRPFKEEHPGMNTDYLMPPGALYDHPQNRKDTAQYIASTKVMDRCIGEVMKAIRETGREEDTIIMYTTDHGLAMPHMKSTLYDDGIGVSLMMQYPGNPTKGKALDALVSHIDVFPTLCDLADIAKPDWLEGVSMESLLKGEMEKVRDEIYAELNYHSSYEPIRCVRTERFKYIRRWEKDIESVVPNHIDNGLSRQFLFDHGWLDMRLDQEELYDLYFDPQERNNKIEHPMYQQIRHDLSGRLEQWMKKTDDPLLEGRVPTPDGYRYYEDRFPRTKGKKFNAGV